MGWPKGFAWLAGGAAALAMLLSAAPAHAQDAASRFGDRDEFIVSVERLFGFQNQKFADDGSSYDHTGFHPIYWGSVGLFSMMPSGLSFGALLGATRYQFDIGDSDLTVNLFQIRPRIGFGGTEKAGRFGYWARIGPNALLVFSKEEDTDSSTGATTSESNTGYAFGIGGEAYAVFFPAPHVGVMVGPHAEFHLAGGGDGDPYYKSAGLTAGIMGEFY